MDNKKQFGARRLSTLSFDEPAKAALWDEFVTVSEEAEHHLYRLYRAFHLIERRLTNGAPVPPRAEYAIAARGWKPAYLWFENIFGEYRAVVSWPESDNSDNYWTALWTEACVTQQIRSAFLLPMMWLAVVGADDDEAECSARDAMDAAATILKLQEKGALPSPYRVR